MVSCEDFLNRSPYDDFTDGDYWKNETQARIFMYGFYPTVFPGYETGNSYSWLSDAGDDAISGGHQTPLLPDVAKGIPPSDGSWTFTNVRKANYVIESVPRIQESDEVKNHWLGVGRFLRGFFYSSLSYGYGDVPYFDKVTQFSTVKADLDYLFKDRDPRAFVVRKNIEDFRFALENVRVNDGALQINRYVVAAMVSRLMLREGTFQKYVGGDLVLAQECLTFAKEAAELVINSNKYSLSSSYKALFASDDLAGNPEIIMYRKYEDAVVVHSMWANNSTVEQTGASKSLAESYSKSNGLPYDIDGYLAPTATDFFRNRDPRLLENIRPQYYPRGANYGPFNYAGSGYSWRKFVNDDRIGEPGGHFNRSGNVTDAPVLRLGEVLLNYAETCYELEALTGTDVFNQGVLDKTINVLRDRTGVMMPHLQEVGGLPAINGITYDDPKRSRQNPVEDVSPMLWEIRRERRIELCVEGFRSSDLKRWHKLDYLSNENNPDFRYGAYIRLSDFPDDVAKSVNLMNYIDAVIVDTVSVVEGFILGNIGDQRAAPVPKNYVKPVPQDQITIYKSRGYKLSQTREWQ
ncbi:hypothetical protein FACS1894162_5050 [Bacteroidia bacterium]|nr:hypothetical protein FACS1894162_5050 [Bacteroidia bacterium]